MRLEPVSPGPRGPGAGPRLRLAAARVALLSGARRREIERLFVLTAAAFGRLAPEVRGRGAKSLLAEYARFTREEADSAIEGGEDLHALEGRLFAAALLLGREYRLRLGLNSFRDAVAGARLIYGALGIDFNCGTEGEAEIRGCPFAAVYTPRVCALVSALDRGLIAGLTSGGEMEFRQRITEGATACRARVTGGRI